MVEKSLVDDLRLAHVLADSADSLTMSRFKALDLNVSKKPDMTDVSDADVAVDQQTAPDVELAGHLDLERREPHPLEIGDHANRTVGARRQRGAHQVAGIRRVVQAAQLWLGGAGRPHASRPCRFDAVLLDRLDPARIDWIRGAFDAG